MLAPPPPAMLVKAPNQVSRKVALPLSPISRSTALVHRDIKPSSAQKRGGDRERLSLDWEAGESQLSIEPTQSDTPEREFERFQRVALITVPVL